MNRRTFLTAIAAAPIAALAPWRPATASTFIGWDVGCGPAYAGIVHYYRGNLVAFVEAFVMRDGHPPLDDWQREVLERYEQQHLARVINPPVFRYGESRIVFGRRP